MKRRPQALSLLLGIALAVTACTSLPDHGPVQKIENTTGQRAPEPPYFQPPGPASGDTRESIVRGFLTAMEANPVSIRTARSFLTHRASEAWRPATQTLVYQASALRVAAGDVGVRLSGISGINSDGAWQPVRVATRDLSLGLVREDGEWRIDSPPDALIVGAAFFRSTFAPYPVYFYDNTGEVLVPGVVHLPRGEETATNLVKALLNGPDASIRTVAASAFPRATQLDLAVTVTRNGVAEVPVSANMLNLPASAVQRAMVQLAWTLRAVPGINRIELTVSGVPVSLADGRTGVGIEEGLDLASFGSRTTRTAVGVQGGRVVVLDSDTVSPTEGPLGRQGFALRSVAQSRDATDLVAISEDGTKAYIAPFIGVERAVRLANGTDFARPEIDRHGRTWLLDQTSQGARIRIANRRTVRTLQVPGISGKQVSQIAISPDGVRMAALVSDDRKPRVVIANLLRTATGRVARALPGMSLSVADAVTITDIGRGVDLGWISAHSLAVLTLPTQGSSRVTTVLVDGSADESIEQVDDLNVVGAQLLAGPFPDTPIGILDNRGNLHLVDAAGKWLEPLPEKFTGIAYAS